MGRDRSARPEAKPERLFVAVEIPDGVKAAVEAAFRPWMDAFPRARWVPAENWHVTVKFLGRTWPRLRGWVPERVAAAGRTIAPFEVSLRRVGSFPSARRGRVLWAGVDDGGRLSDVAAALDEALASEFHVEARAFHAHLTVARSDPPVELPEAFSATELRSAPWQIDELVLFRSHLRRPAPRYEPIGRFPLSGSGTGSRGE